MMEDGVGCRGCRPEAGVLSPDVGTGRMGVGNKSDGGLWGVWRGTMGILFRGVGCKELFLGCIK